ncbi:MAG TPA: 50S ribosomal protein L37ae [Candidatus Nanoarchaeia archaeon]|nr:50S ribosomal protein L37ae [Candidatus Nanoarchaeia archaeon]
MARNKRGPAGRFGARYGASLRRKVQEVEERLKAQKQCPDCKKMTLRRIASGIWQCNKCEIKFAGGAYEM